MTLSDKIVSSEEYDIDFIYTEDVREAVKELKALSSYDLENHLLEKLHQIFGEKLI